MTKFTALDMILILLMGFGAFMGFMRGFVQEALSLAAWGLVIVGLKFLHEPLTNKLEAVGSTNHSAASVVAFAAVVVVIGGLGRYFARRLGQGTRESLLGPFDRVLGVGFGAIKGLIAATLIYLVGNLGTDIIWGGDSERPEWIASSKTYPLLQASSRAIIDFVDHRRNGGSEGKSKSKGKSDKSVTKSQGEPNSDTEGKSNGDIAKSLIKDLL
ncbi:CvpA family protein [Aquisediminimonas sediminicola]|uniref:CvpA family protein n=1 Tax=Alteraquisediminimonas sediminicola TaxID=2676787 RepID=UPI001C8DA736|nr:CvpA family protein [Aquisediminimonas sediminicola]